MKVLRHPFSTIFAPRKTWIAAEYGYIAFALHWLNFTTFWQEKTS